MHRIAVASILVALSLSCAGGRKWVHETPEGQSKSRGSHWIADDRPRGISPSSPGSNGSLASKDLPDQEWADAPGKRPLLALEGTPADTGGPPDAISLGLYRNTYYDFPAESEYQGPNVPLMNASCKKLADVPRPFFEAVCVQGSGTLSAGFTVSFARRDCGCAEICPRTGQKLCFDALDAREFPWGRGATGKAITPLRTIAVDTSIIPLGTILYIAEFDGVSRSPSGPPHDGCFVAEDRGMKVVGEHVDIFTGNPRITAHLNKIVPSNRGVHVYTRTARCE